jgi:hypothetical protein
VTAEPKISAMMRMARAMEIGDVDVVPLLLLFFT